MSPAHGSKVGPYEIVALIGAGGMGEVYRGRDTRLNRDVALKILPDLFAHDSERVARFTREAQTLASLNHPNIAQIYGIVEEEGGGTHLHALVMELVDGEDLSQRIARGAIPLAEALSMAKQIADALEAAHEQGVIHRDLKPANIKVRDDGTVKVLDFGLAKAMDPGGASGADAISSPTLTGRATQMGMIIGTAAYMAPEQAKGKSVDRRADVWAFGVVLYEMLSGQRAFKGDDVTEVLASVVLRDPDLSALPAETPAGVRRLLSRCLQKDPKRRLRDIAEGMLQLEDSSSESPVAQSATSGAGMPPAAPPRPKRSLWRVALLLAAILLAGAAVATAIWWYWTPPAVEITPVRFSVAPVDATRIAVGGTVQNLAISPDGKTIVYLSPGSDGLLTQMHLRTMDQLEPTVLRGAGNGIAPFLSPDSMWVGFGDISGGSLKKVSILGGPPVTLCELPSAMVGAAWLPSGVIVFGTVSSGLFTVPEGGGPPTPLTELDPKQGEASHSWPSFVAGANAVVFVTAKSSFALATGQLAVVSLDTRKVTRLAISGTSPRVLPTGHLIYATPDGTLRAQAFDRSALAATGNPVPVLEGVGVKQSGAANYAVSDDGRLVYLANSVEGSLRSLVWVDRAGKETPLEAPRRTYVYAWISPDGTRASLDIRDQENDIWVWDFARKTLTRLTFDPGLDQYGLWTPDSRRVAFSGVRGAASGLFLRSADGTGTDERLTTGAATQFPNAISPDGSLMVFRQPGGTGREDDLFVLPLAARAGAGDAPKPEVLVSTARVDRNAAISPDGRWVAYESNDSGTFQVFVQPFPDVRGGRWQISTAGGTEPVWSRDGRELFYIANGKMMATRVETAPAFTPGTPVELFGTEIYYLQSVGRNFDVAPDGRRFLMIKDSTGASGGTRAVSMTVVLNWFEEIRARMPKR